MSGLLDNFFWETQRNAGLPDIMRELSGVTGDRQPGSAPPMDLSRDFMVQSENKPKGDGSVASPGVDMVWPSHAFYDSVGLGPAAQRQIGALQAAGLAGANSLGFGMPLALMERFAPDAAARAHSIMGAHPNEKMVAGIGGAIGNPLNVGMRAAGNALAQKGYGVGSQAVADGVTAAALNSIPNAIGNRGVKSGDDIPVSTAMASRFLMPALPPGVMERTLRGVQSGAVSQLPYAALTGDVMRPIAGGAYGAGHGMGLRRGRSEGPALPTRYGRGEAAGKWLNPMGAASAGSGASLLGLLGDDDETDSQRGLSLP